MSLKNAAAMNTSTTGTGTLTLNAALGGFQSFAAAGAIDGETIPYAIQDAANTWELGYGTYTTSGTTLARTTIKASSSGGAAISVTSAATIYSAALADTLASRVYQSYLSNSSVNTTFAVTGGYTPGQIDVYINGVHLANTEYTATNGSSVVLSVAALDQDIVEVTGWLALSMVPASQRIYQSNTANSSVNTTFTITGGYIPGQIDVYLNGVHLANTEYTAVDSSTVVLGSAALVGSVVEFTGYSAFIMAVNLAGANQQVQFNDSGVFGASAGLTFDKAANNITVANTVLLGANVSISTTTLFIGNSTANMIANSTTIEVTNSTAKFHKDPGGFSIGNSTANNFGNSTIEILANSSGQTVSTPISISMGNSVANTFANSIFESIANSTANTSYTPNQVSVANSTANAQMGIGTLILQGTGSNVGLTVGTSTKAANGATFLPNGFLLQWVRGITGAAPGTTRYTWPVTFTNIYQVSATAIMAAQTANFVSVFNANTTGCNVCANLACNVSVIAIGN